MTPFSRYLQEIFKYDSPFISSITSAKGIYYNHAIFPGPVENLGTFKRDFFERLDFKEEQLQLLKMKITNAESLSETEKEALLKEIFVLMTKINLKREVYQIEANKINPDFELYEGKDVNFDYYNEVFFSVDLDYLFTSKYKKIEDYNLPELKEIEIPKYEVVKLLSVVNKYAPDMQFNFGDFINMSHSKGKIKIPDSSCYSLRSIITIFFHEVSHHFRYLNQLEQFDVKTPFSDYFEIEEGLAIYNEYKYGNEIMEIGEFVPFYDLCYLVLLEDISEQEKKDKIYEILKYKGFSRKKSDSYYQRFNRFTLPGDKNLFLKDVIYYNSYQLVTESIKKDPSFHTNAYTLMGGYKALEMFPDAKPLFDPLEYFEEIKDEIIKLKEKYE